MAWQSQTESNKALIKKFLEAFSESRFGDALDLMHDDGSLWVAGATDISGTYAKEAFRELATGEAGGIRYLKQYYFLFETSNKKIMAVREYMDPMHVREVFGASPRSEPSCAATNRADTNRADTN